MSSWHSDEGVTAVVTVVAKGPAEEIAAVEALKSMGYGGGGLAYAEHEDVGYVEDMGGLYAYGLGMSLTEADMLVVLPGWMGDRQSVLAVLIAGYMNKPVYIFHADNKLSELESAVHWVVVQHGEQLGDLLAGRGSVLDAT